MSSLASLPFYHGTLDTRECRELLPEIGDYLLRNAIGEMDKEDVAGTSSTCILTVAIAPEKEGYSIKQLTTTRLKSYAIIEQKDGLVSVQNTKEPFSTVQELLDSFVKSKKTLPAGGVLQKAVARHPWQLMLSELEFPSREVVLGEGSYGKVVKARLRKKNGEVLKVAVKATNEGKDATEFSEVYTEARAMRRLQHPNIIGLEGVVVEKLPILLVIEFFDGSCLLSALQKHKVPDTMRFPIVCSIMYGVEYMHSKNYIHRDIASRNIMVSADCRKVKIIDYGLAKHGLTFKLKIPQKVPVKWLAPEAIQSFIFSTKSDVWAFGITAWEVYHDGAEPYTAAVKNQKVKCSMRRKKGREDQDELRITENTRHLPKLFADLFPQILHKNLRDRPEMADIVREMEQRIIPSLDGLVAHEVLVLQRNLTNPQQQPSSNSSNNPSTSGHDPDQPKPSLRTPTRPRAAKIAICITKTRRGRGKRSGSASASTSTDMVETPIHQEQ